MSKFSSCRYWQLKNINHNHSTKQLLEKWNQAVLFSFGKFGVGERSETISLTYIALSRTSFKCIKIAVTKSYIINCVTALKCLNLKIGSHLSNLSIPILDQQIWCKKFSMLKILMIGDFHWYSLSLFCQFFMLFLLLLLDNGHCWWKPWSVIASSVIDHSHTWDKNIPFYGCQSFFCLAHPKKKLPSQTVHHCYMSRLMTKPTK